MKQGWNFNVSLQLINCGKTQLVSVVVGKKLILIFYDFESCCVGNMGTIFLDYKEGKTTNRK